MKVPTPDEYTRSMTTATLRKMLKIAGRETKNHIYAELLRRKHKRNR